MDYRVYWTGIEVGKIIVFDHGLRELEGRPCHKIEVDAKTTGAVEKLYKDRRRYLAYLTPEDKSWIYEEWEKDDDKWRMQESLGFLTAQNLVRRFKKGKLRNEIRVPKDVLDPVGAGYRVRSFPLDAGVKLEAVVSEGKHLYRGTADVVRGGTFETVLGPVATLCVLPKVYWNGEPLGEREFKVWFTADERRIPVRLFADVEFGSFSADLVEYRPPQSKKALTSTE